MAISDNSKDLCEITGTVEQVVYQNTENSYTVIDVFDVNGDLLTAVGIMPYVSEGDTVILAGKWKTHPSFGKQFEVEYFDRTLPSEESDILRYLSSGTIKGIGPKIAQRIVGRYGGESFDIIENHPEWLADIPGISMKKAAEMSDSFKEQFGVRNIMLLAKGEISATVAIKIVKRYKSGASDIIRKNPYVLCENISGFGFEKCDRLASILGIESDSIFRVKSGIIYLLNYNADKNGHTYLPEDKLEEGACALLGVDISLVKQAVEELAFEKKIIPIFEDGRRVIYSAKYYNAEKYSADKLLLLDRVCLGYDNYDKGMFIDRIELESGISYATLQRKAIETAIENGVMILTGGPGTGKTTVIRALIRIFENMSMSVSLGAPTGRAAKRMSDSTSYEAKTIHRMLEMERSDDDILSFRRDENDQLDADVVIIDEASMLGITLFEALLKAIKPGARLLLIGDSSQLPSVGAGNVLADLIASERFATVCLTEIFRQAQESLIVTNAHAINRGEYPDLSVRDKDFFFLSRESDQLCSQTVADLYAERLPKTYGEKAVGGIQVITPTRNGVSGTESLNKLLQERLNPYSPEKNERKSHGVIFREGDRVMQIKNNYELEWKRGDKSGVGVFNGDIGVIEEIDNVDEKLTVNFDNRLVKYDFTSLDELEHSYAITVHKSQGSEYPIVILPLCTAAPMLLTRNLLYTAVTRAQNMVIIVGRRSTVALMVDNNRQTVRYTGLCRMIREQY